MFSTIKNHPKIKWQLSLNKTAAERVLCILNKINYKKAETLWSIGYVS